MEYGRAGGLKGSKEGKRCGGLAAWQGKTPEQQAALLVVFAQHVGKRKGAGANRSVKAREAQRARAKAAYRAPMTSAKARFLADAGMLKRAPLPAGYTPPVAQPVAARAPYIINGWVAPEGFPREEDYAEGEWMPAVNRWHAADGRRKAGL